MKGIKQGTIFLLIFGCCFALLSYRPLGLCKAYSRLFCTTGNELYGDFGKDGIVMLKPTADNGEDDIALFISRKAFIKDGKLTGMTYYKSCSRIGFLPLVFLASMVIATRISWKRKIVALAAGFILMGVFVMLKLLVIIKYSYVSTPWLGMYPDENTRIVISHWYERFGGPMAIGYSFALVLWAGLSTGRREVAYLSGLPYMTVRKAADKRSNEKKDRVRDRKRQSPGKSRSHSGPVVKTVY